MTVIAFGSVTGAPGVSTLVQGVATVWRDGADRVVVEADCDGGRLATSCEVGVDPGLMSIGVSARSGHVSGDDLAEAAVKVGPWWLLPSPMSGEHTHQVITNVGDRLANAVAADRSRVWLIDTGRLSMRTPSLAFAQRADLTVLVTDGSLAGLQQLPTRVDALHVARCNVGVVVVGELAWPAGEVAQFVGADVLGRVPRVKDPGRPVSGKAWRTWWAAVEGLVGVLVASCESVASVVSG